MFKFLHSKVCKNYQ